MTMTREELDAQLTRTKRENAATVAAIRSLGDFDIMLLDAVLKASSHVSASALRGKIADARKEILNPTPPLPPMSAEDSALIDEIYNRLK